MKDEFEEEIEERIFGDHAVNTWDRVVTVNLLGIITPMHMMLSCIQFNEISCDYAYTIA